MLEDGRASKPKAQADADLGLETGYAAVFQQSVVVDRPGRCQPMLTHDPNVAAIQRRHSVKRCGGIESASGGIGQAHRIEAGIKVAELLNTKMDAGKYSYQWDASNVAAGTYFYELRTDKFVSVKKMMLLK